MKTILTTFMVLLGLVLPAQDPVYLLFEFMRVDNEQESSYAETEDFWEKIHQQRADNGDINGWDLWALQPGGEDQNFQYLTVHVYDDPVKMMDGEGPEAFMASAKAAYPNLSEDELMAKLEGSGATRDLAARIYLHLIETTEDDYEMPVGSIAVINFMKTGAGQGASYVKMEREVFLPMHQESVDQGRRGSWGLAEVMFPYGSDVYASHLTFDMFENYQQLFDELNYDGNTPSEDQMKAIQEGLATRDQKWTIVGRLIKKVRPSDMQAAEN